MAVTAAEQNRQQIITFFEEQRSQPQGVNSENADVPLRPSLAAVVVRGHLSKGRHLRSLSPGVEVLM